MLGAAQFVGPAVSASPGDLTDLAEGVLLDEAQNTTAVQMKMFLTRLGEQSHMVVTGDLSQVDLPRGVRSGLRDAFEVLSNVDGLHFVNFDETDVVRHPLVGRIVKAYGKMESRRGTGARYQTN